MRHLMIVTAAGLLGLASPALAQGLPGQPRPPQYGVGYRPQLSPYLDLTRNNGNLAANYFLGTVPEQQRRADAAAFRARIDDLEDRNRQDRQDNPIVSGTTPIPNTMRMYFNNTGAYFATRQQGSLGQPPRR